MLVLSRYRDESIYIGDDVIITVVDIRGDRVRLGIQAPPQVSVHRQEIYDAINREKQQVEKGRQEPAPTEKRASHSKSAEGPLGKKLAEAKGQGLPVDLDSSIELGGFTDVIPQ